MKVYQSDVGGFQPAEIALYSIKQCLNLQPIEN